MSQARAAQEAVREVTMRTASAAFACLLWLASANAQGSNEDVARVEDCLSKSAEPRKQEDCIGYISEACEGNTTAEMVACYKREQAAWEAILGRTSTRLGNRLPSADRTHLQSTQRAWTSYRQLACQWPYHVREAGTVRPVEAASCMARQTALRTIDLLVQERAQTGEP